MRGKLTSDFQSLPAAIEVDFCLLLILVLAIPTPLAIGSPVKFQDGDLRLDDGDTSVSGTVSIFLGYTWGRICDDLWTINEANVVCRQLGHGYAVRATKRNHFHSRSSRNYFMDSVRCTGNETRLEQCKFGGWARHDCSAGEDAGVQCAMVFEVRSKVLWNAMNLNYSKEAIIKMKKVSFVVKSMPIPDWTFKPLPYVADTAERPDPRIILIHPGSEDALAGAICPDQFTSIDAIVACKQINAGIGGKIIEVPMQPDIFPSMRHIAIIGHCYGNETELSKCQAHINENGVQCKSSKAVAVACQRTLPDMTSDVYALMSSLHIVKLRLWHLECALEEHCFPNSVYTYIANNPTTYRLANRVLLRFSSITKNLGTAPFLPNLIPDHWEWHPCHAHYHSMKVFGRYEVTDEMNRLITYGHKASFCLEDNSCNRDANRTFFCSNVMDKKGMQGISPGCQDEYFFNYDCQWVDVTDIAPGNYTYTVSYNPDFYVPESNYFNNAVRCALEYRGYWARFSNCEIVHPLDIL